MLLFRVRRSRKVRVSPIQKELGYTMSNATRSNYVDFLPSVSKSLKFDVVDEYGFLVISADKTQSALVVFTESELGSRSLKNSLFAPEETLFVNAT
jgi:hypothetical protein